MLSQFFNNSSAFLCHAFKPWFKDRTQMAGKPLITPMISVCQSSTLETLQPINGNQWKLQYLHSMLTMEVHPMLWSFKHKIFLLQQFISSIKAPPLPIIRTGLHCSRFWRIVIGLCWVPDSQWEPSNSWIHMPSNLQPHAKTFLLKLPCHDPGLLTVECSHWLVTAHPWLSTRIEPSPEPQLTSNLQTLSWMIFVSYHSPSIMKTIGSERRLEEVKQQCLGAFISCSISRNASSPPQGISMATFRYVIDPSYQTMKHCWPVSLAPCNPTFEHSVSFLTQPKQSNIKYGTKFDDSNKNHICCWIKLQIKHRWRLQNSWTIV